MVPAPVLGWRLGGWHAASEGSVTSWSWSRTAAVSASWRKRQAQFPLGWPGVFIRASEASPQHVL